MTYVRPTISSLIAALRGEVQERDSRPEPSNNVSYATAITTTTTTTTTTSTAKDAETGRRAEAMPESRSRHPEVRPRPNNKRHNGRSHAQYQSHWKEWCIRKEFSDGDWVTREKFVSYLRELTAPQSYTDSDVPRLSIKPLFVKSRDGSDIRRASLATLEAYMKAVRSLYEEQCLVDGIIPNDSLGKNEIEMILSDYENMLSYTTFMRVGEGGDEDEGEEDEDEDGADEDNMDGVDASGEGSPVQEETSSKETEASSTAPSAQESRQQSDNEKEAKKKEKPKKKSGSKRIGRALSPVSQSQDPLWVFAGTTQRRHLTHQTQWKEWCIRKRYTDGHRVTAEKFVAFARELTARDEYYDKDNPHLCIKPFIANIHKGADVRRPSKGTVRGALTAVRALYMDQCNVEKVKPNVTKDLAKTAIDVIMSDYEKLLEEGPSLPRIITPDGQILLREGEHQQNGNQETAQQEPEDLEAYNREIDRQEVLRENTPQEDVQQEDVQQENVQQESVEPENIQEHGVQEKTIRENDTHAGDANKESSMIQLKKIMKSLWNPQTKHSSRGHSWMIAHRERLRLAFGYFETDSRNNLATLVPPQLYHLQIRPEDEDQIPTQGVAVMVDFRKQYTDSLRYSIFLREEDVQVCPIGALAFFLLGKWTEKKSFPDFGIDDWATEPIEYLKDAPKAGENISSEQDGGANSAALFADIIEANTEERPYSSFFDFINPSPNRHTNGNKKVPPIILTATLPQPSVFRLPRNRLLPPLDLQRQLFPFIEDVYDDNADWKMWVENIMMDRPEDTDRLPEKDKDFEYHKADFPLIRHLLFVAGLRKVVLQDFAAMMACETEEDGEKKTGFDHVFAVKHPVLSSPAFKEFAAQLREAMAAGPVVVKANVPTEAQESPENEVVQSLEVQETVQASTKTTTKTKMTTTTKTTNTNRSVTRKGKNDQSRASALDLTASSTDVVRVSVATGSPNQPNETDSLLEVIRALCARVASLEQMEMQESELATSASATTFLTDTISGDKDASMDKDSNMDVDMDEEAANGALRSNDTRSSKDDADRLRRENQSLRKKVAALERVNRELAEENQRQSSLSRTPEPHVLSTPPAASPTLSRITSRASYELNRAPSGRFDRRENNSNIISATTACSAPNSIIQDYRTIATASITPTNTHSNIYTNIKDRHRSHSVTSASTSTCEASTLRQEVQDLRIQLASLEQEEKDVLDYAAVAIESVEFLDNKVLQIEQSMHGLWTMIARNEAAKFASTGSVGPRSPVMGMASTLPPPPPLSPLHQQHQQQQYQDPFVRANVGARLRVDTLPLRSRTASSASAASAASGSGVHSKMRS